MDAVIDQDVRITNKRGKYYDLPVLMQLRPDVVELVTIVTKMVSLVIYDRSDTRNSEVHIATRLDGNRENQGYITTLKDFLGSKNPMMKPLFSTSSRIILNGQMKWSLHGSMMWCLLLPHVEANSLEKNWQKYSANHWWFCEN